MLTNNDGEISVNGIIDYISETSNNFKQYILNI